MTRVCFFVLLGFNLLGSVGCNNESSWNQSILEIEKAIHHNKYDYAEELLLKTLPQAEIFGESDQRLATVLYLLGEVYRQQNKYSKAEPYFWRALPIWSKSVGAEHPKMAAGLSGLAKVHQARKEYKKAEALFKQALKIREKNFGVNSKNITPSLEEYSLLLRLMNHSVEAAKLETRRKSILAE